MKSFFVYMLRCGDGSFYTGVTNNVEERIAAHKAGIDPNAYSFKRRPVEYVYSHEFDSIKDAIAWEKKLKGWSRKKKEALISGDWEKVHVLAMNKSNKEKIQMKK